MRVAVTGTPGTGKSTAVEHLRDEHVVHLNEVIREEGLWTERDEDRDSLVADVDAVRDWLGDWDGVVESHLAHLFDADRVVVLRCAPEELERRLLDRGERPEKARENAESEALDVILAEAVERHGEDHVYEIDTTEQSPEETAQAIEAVVDGTREPSAGTVNFIDYL